ncbi:MAG: HK97 family phage prohead protease [Bacillota bacterium]
MVENLSSDFVYDEKERITLGWVSVEAKDKQEEIIKTDDLYKAMLLTQAEKGHISINDGHSNRSIGKVVSFHIEEHPQLKVKGIKAIYKVYSTCPYEDKVWQEIKSGKRKGLSIGGLAYGKEYEKDENGKNISIPIDLALFEISSVENPANPYAINEGVNMFAKGESKIEEEKVKADFEELIKQGNPWAICSAQVGREDKAKYERCVLHVKEGLGMKKSADEIQKEVKELFTGDIVEANEKETPQTSKEDEFRRIDERFERIGEIIKGITSKLEAIELALSAKENSEKETVEKEHVIEKEGPKIIVKSERPVDTAVSDIEKEDIAYRIAKGEKIDIHKIIDENQMKKEEEIRNFFKK